MRSPSLRRFDSSTSSISSLPRSGNRLLGTLLAGILAAASAAGAQGNLRFDLPAQSLEETLRSIGKSGDLNILINRSLVEGLRAPTLKGDLSIDEALTQVLRGTGLVHKFVNEHTIVLQADAQDISGRFGIPEVLVTGSRSLNADMRRSEDDPQPYVVFEREQMDQAMAVTLEDFLRTRLPMNTSRDTNAQVAGYEGGNQSSINLRGLGASQTLILLNGRRLPNINFGGSFMQPDINSIPMTSIERVEVLPSTASGIYGGGATGGVINVITREFSGLDVSVSYGSPLDTHVANRRMDASAGFSLLDGRTRMMISAAYADSDPLLNSERDFIEHARARQMASNAAGVYALATPPVGYTSNVRSVDGGNLVLDDGTPLNSPRTHVPVGYAGPASDGGRALLANAGEYNLDMPQTVLGAYRPILNGTTMRSATFNVRHELSPRIELIADFAWGNNRSDSATAQLPSAVTLAANAPNNPFTTPIRVSFPAIGFVPPARSESDSLRALGSMIVRLGGDWSLSADYGWARSRISFFATDDVIGDPDGSGPGLSGNAALASGALDVMRDVNAHPLDYSPYLSPIYNIFGPARTNLDTAALRVSGPLLQLPGGPLSVSGMVERREETSESTSQLREMFGGLLYVPEASQDVMSYYSELRAPVIGSANALPWLRSLELQVSARRDNYETSAETPRFHILPSSTAPLPVGTKVSNEVGATKYTLGLSFSPVQDVQLRASLGTGFLPPAIQQISKGTPFVSSGDVVDPRRGGVPALAGPFDVTGGGNPNLQPEDSRSWSVGMILIPRVLPGLRLSLDYTHIEKEREITSLAWQTLLDLEDVLPGRVTRAPLTAEDQARGYTGGVITALDISMVNLAHSELAAYDVQTDYTWDLGDWGRVHLYALATWQPYLERQTLPTLPIVDSVGFAYGQLEWRGNAGASWQWQGWMVGWSAQYFDSYRIYTATAAPASAAASVLNQGAVTVPRQIYHDLTARYRFDGAAGAFADTEIMLGIQNVFDRQPPVISTTGTAEGYSTYADPRLRRVMLNLRKAF